MTITKSSTTTNFLKCVNSRWNDNNGSYHNNNNNNNHWKKKKKEKNRKKKKKKKKIALIVEQMRYRQTDRPTDHGQIKL